MADERKPGDERPQTEAERLRLQALADKRNRAMDMTTDAIRKQDEARRAIVDKMR